MNACFIAYIVQAIINNFAPLLFLRFQEGYGIPLSKITLLVTVNFGIQLTVDLASAGFVDKIGYRASMLIAHICAAAGLLSLTVLPEAFSDPFVGLLLSVIIYAVGGGHRKQPGGRRRRLASRKRSGSRNTKAFPAF